jgi:glycosidase
MDEAIEYHKELIGNLRKAGVDGFRLDAAKHIPASYLKRS